MQYSVKDILAVRDKFRDPPFPGFSIDEMCRRRRTAQTKLVRSEHAWNPQVTAKSTEEWVRRLMNGSLNKLSPQNYGVLIEKMKTKEIFSTAEILKSVVAIMFNKVLSEPEYSNLLARACNDLASYEVNLQNEGGPRCSDFRDALLVKAQEEFRVKERKPDAAKEAAMTKEELDLLESTFARRKRANMRFVGELYLSKLITFRSVREIIGALIDPQSGKPPTSINLELFNELMETCGRQVDVESKGFLTPFFSFLEGIKSNKDYPSRIRFMVMNLCDLREAKWTERPPLQTSKVSSSSSSRKSALPARKAKGGRDAKSPSSALAASFAKAAAAKAAREETAEVPETPLVSFKQRVETMFREWVENRTDDFILDWIAEFGSCDRAFESNAEVCEAVAMEIVETACCTTRAGAQREAYSFMLVGLDLTDDEMFTGLAAAVASAVEDGLLCDVPKYTERFMNIMCLTSPREERPMDVYYDTAKVLVMAFKKLGYVDSTTVESLMSFWEKIPEPPQEALMEGEPNFSVFVLVGELDGDPTPGLEKLLSALIHSMHRLGVVGRESLQEFLDYSEGSDFYNKVVAEYKASSE